MRRVLVVSRFSAKIVGLTSTESFLVVNLSSSTRVQHNSILTKLRVKRDTMEVAVEQNYSKTNQCVCLC